VRFAVSRLLGMLAAGKTEAEILRNHPDLQVEDVRATGRTRRSRMITSSF
jgi:uncharacterized protein (DUF433 family)